MREEEVEEMRRCDEAAAAAAAAASAVRGARPGGAPRPSSVGDGSRWAAMLRLRFSVPGVPGKLPAATAVPGAGDADAEGEGEADLARRPGAAVVVDAATPTMAAALDGDGVDEPDAGGDEAGCRGGMDPADAAVSLIGRSRGRRRRASSASGRSGLAAAFRV